MEAKRHIEPFKPAFLLLGCKCDLADLREIPVDEGESYATSLGIHFTETSAKTGKNVEEAFQVITQEIYNKIQTGEYKVDDEHWEGIKTGPKTFTNPVSLLDIPEGLPEGSKCCF